MKNVARLILAIPLARLLAGCESVRPPTAPAQAVSA